MKRKTKAELEVENKLLKRKISDLRVALDSLSSLALGVTIYGIVATAIIVAVAFI